MASLSFSLTTNAQAPTVTAVAVDLPGHGAPAFRTGETIAVGVVFSETVTVTSAPRLALDVGGVTRQAAYALGSSAMRLIFTYRVQAADVDHDGIGAGALILNGGAARTASRVNAALGLGDHAFANAWNLRVNSGQSAPRFHPGHRGANLPSRRRRQRHAAGRHRCHGIHADRPRQRDDAEPVGRPHLQRDHAHHRRHAERGSGGGKL